MAPLAHTTLSAARTRKLVERAAYLQHHIHRMSLELDALKNDFKGLGAGLYLGTGHKVTVTAAQAVRLDSALVRACLSPAEIRACTTTTTVTRVLIKEI